VGAVFTKVCPRGGYKLAHYHLFQYRLFNRKWVFCDSDPDSEIDPDIWTDLHPERQKVLDVSSCWC